jgi:hypothetical protein
MLASIFQGFLQPPAWMLTCLDPRDQFTMLIAMKGQEEIFLLALHHALP